MYGRNAVQFLSLYIKAVQPFFDSLFADAGVNQQMGIIAAHINTVAAASAGDTA